MARHLSMQERDQIARLKDRGARQKEIAQALQRSCSTISRELRRNATGGDYLAAQAQHKATARRSDRPLLRKMDDRAIKATVRRELRRYWSPDQIAGRLRLLCFEEQRRVSARTIYGWIAAGEEGRRCRRFLRNRGKRGFRPKRPDPIGAPLRDRPQVIEDRLRLGDFEGDTVLGPGPGGLATLVDRKSRYSVVLKIQSKQANHVQKRISRRLKQLDESRRRSVTFDHGTEFARCHRLQRHPGLELYLAEPGKPHQRGTNENTNGLIRQFFPKGTRFRKVTPQQVHRVQNLLNDRPRACLGYRTPNEVYFGDPAPKNCV